MYINPVLALNFHQTTFRVYLTALQNNTFKMVQVFENLVVAILIIAKYAAAVPCELTFYTNPDATGEGITISKTHLDFGCVTNTLGGMRSVCHTGPWQYTTPGGGGVIFAPESWRKCSSLENYISNVTNVFLAGPANTATPAITFAVFGTQIYVIDGLSDANIELARGVITYIYTTGTSDWTLFEHPDFEGRSACVRSFREVNRHYASDFGLPTIHSVIRGCGLTQEYINSMRENKSSAN